MRNYYRILGLGVPETANADEIRSAFRQMAKKHHPDRSGDSGADAFREATDAYEALKDHRRRRGHDAALAHSRRPMTAQAFGREWFADEVAIDFPSINSVVDRIREAFFGIEAVDRPLSAEVLLTRHEAFYGVKIPLDVPVRRTCSSCGGRGEIWMETCPHCGGDGSALFCHHVQLSVPPGVRHGTRFRFSVTHPYAPATYVEVRITIQ